jgi:hypothetical protein
MERKALLGGPQGYAVGASETFRTVSLGTRVKVFRWWRTRRNPGTSVRRSTLEDSPTQPAVPATTRSKPMQGTRLWDSLLLTYC